MKLFQRCTERQFNQTLNKMQGFIKKKGVDALIDACAQTLPAELRESAFANACDIVLADGVVEPDEKQFIDDLLIKLELDKKRAKTIVQVMVFKNQG